MTTLREKLIKIGAKVVSHARYIIFQLAEVAVPRNLHEDKTTADCSDMTSTVEKDRFRVQ